MRYELIDQLISQMNPIIQRRDWNNLEATYHTTCKELADQEHALRIRNVDIAVYQMELCNTLTDAIILARKKKAKAVYFEYDPDNSWKGDCFICTQYFPETERNDDWASEWITYITGPKLEAFSDIYREAGGFAKTNRAVGSTSYLIARTVAIFGRCVEYNDIHSLAICIAYHDQDPITRIVE